jgi:glycosyltransferase involved in cell wall biosynthesis
MRILVDVRHLADTYKTGVGEYTTELLRALFELDRENEYVLFSSGVTKPSISTLHLRIPNKLLKVSTYLTGRPYLPHNADLVFLPNIGFTSLPPKTKNILTIHDLSWHITPEFFSWRMRIWHHGTRPRNLIANASAVIVPSHSVKEDVIRIFQKPADLIHVIPHGVNPMFSPMFTPQDHGVRSRLKLPKRFALFVGTLEPRKNILTIIEAVETYRRETGDDLHLVLAGTLGWKSSNIKRVLSPNTKYQIPNTHIHHLGYIPSADRPALYRAAQVFVWPSHYEGFGLPVLEAMASGLPVITSATTAIPELTKNAAVLVDPHDPRDLVEALKQTRSSQTLRDRLRAAGLARAAHFSWQKTAEQTLQLFQTKTE